MNIKSFPIYLDIQKILPLTINLMVAVVKRRDGVLCPLKNSTSWKFFYRHHQLTSDNRSNVSERDSCTSKVRSFRGKETEKFHFTGEKPNQIGTRSSTQNLNLTGNDLSFWARRHAVCYQRYKALTTLQTGTSSFPKTLAHKGCAALKS